MTDAPSDTVLEVIDLKRVVGDRTIITDLSFTVRAGDIIFIRGASGVGKSLLLRSLAYLDPIQVKTNSRMPMQWSTPNPSLPLLLMLHYGIVLLLHANAVTHGFHAQGGTLLLNGKTPQQLGVPNWRTQVTYVPQSRTQQKGTPSELYFAAQVLHQLLIHCCLAYIPSPCAQH